MLGFVQMEVVMPSKMTVRESHDIALVLQHKVEGFDEVERAFVHGKPACHL
jgi:divalent metal cation (Fe/Co/Zn/Cd) transporter